MTASMKHHAHRCAQRWAPLYKVLHWGWTDDHHIPTSAELEEMLLRLIDQTLQLGYSTTSTGGLVVTWDKEGLTLSFCDDVLVSDMLDRDARGAYKINSRRPSGKEPT